MRRITKLVKRIMNKEGKTYDERVDSLQVGDVVAHKDGPPEEITQIIHNNPNDTRNFNRDRITINGLHWEKHAVTIITCNFSIAMEHNKKKIAEGLQNLLDELD